MLSIQSYTPYPSSLLLTAILLVSPPLPPQFKGLYWLGKHTLTLPKQVKQINNSEINNINKVNITKE